MSLPQDSDLSCCQRCLPHNQGVGNTNNKVPIILLEFLKDVKYFLFTIHNVPHSRKRRREHLNNLRTVRSQLYYASRVVKALKAQILNVKFLLTWNSASCSGTREVFAHCAETITSLPLSPCRGLQLLVATIFYLQLLFSQFTFLRFTLYVPPQILIFSIQTSVVSSTTPHNGFLPFRAIIN